MAAYADEFIQDLPEQYDTEIGERGVKLSGGQRQRLAIARALLANPRILILDEATSLVDTEAEQMIQKALENLMQGRTTFVIAHRLSTVRKADKIVVIDDGEVVEEADHETLMQQQGLYAEMYERQFRIAEDWGLGRGGSDGAGLVPQAFQTSWVAGAPQPVGCRHGPCRPRRGLCDLGCRGWTPRLTK